MACALDLSMGLMLLALLGSCFLVASGSSNVHIVYLEDTGVSHNEQDILEDSHLHILSNILGSKRAARSSILYSYKYGFSGFAAVLSQSQAKLIADFPGVVRVIPNKILSVHTTRSWDFLSVNPYIVNGILSKSQSGRGTIIGILDTGIWPESESFRDEHMDNPPSRWRGICQVGENFNQSQCNRKIIGARWYSRGYEAEFGKLNTSDGSEFLSPRDAAGHGTHTSSTAGGVTVENASMKGLAKGSARGGAPSAHIAIYKICWYDGECSSADLLAAFDDAIHDGVDVLSVSLGSSPPVISYVDDVLAIGSFHAVAKGVSVVCSGGNSGPYPQTVINTAPWIITVAASTLDRAFPSTITLGNNQTLHGQSLYIGKDVNKFYPIVYGEDIAYEDSDGKSAKSCESGSLNATLAKGKTILCFQSGSQRSAMGAIRTVTEVQGSGIIFAQYPSKDVALSWSIPSVQVDFITGTSILSYMLATSNSVVKFSKAKTRVGQQISPEVAIFSSRGPSSLSPSVLKPDIAAPGVDILAAWSPASTEHGTGNELLSLNFMIESGTSMSCPHISGIVSLLKSIYPTWSPAAIKSALITTASLKNEYNLYVGAEGAPYKQADPFDYGGGHVDPNKVINPGLIYDLKTSDYVRFLCSMGYNNTAITLMTKSPTKCHKSPKFLLNLNLPSITIPELKYNNQPLTVSRSVTNVGPGESTYVARVVAPIGVSVTVVPQVLKFNATRKEMKFKVSFWSKINVEGGFSFGYLFWEDGSHEVRIPLAVRTVVDRFYADA